MEQLSTGGLHSRKTSQLSQVPGHHLVTPANMSWAQNLQAGGQLHGQLHGLEQVEESEEIKEN